MLLKTKLEKVISNSYKNMAGLIVLKKGQTVYENYFNDCNENSPVHIFSVTKSIVSLLIGIAIDQGLIQGVDQKILDFYPDYKVKSGEKILEQLTIKHLLTMTVPYKFKEEPYSAYFSSNNWVKAALDLIGGKEPIGTFRYAPIIGPDILTGILVKATGKTVLEFANEVLFSHLGISVGGDIIFHDKEEQMAFYKTKSVQGWVLGPDGTHTAGWGLNLTTRDMAKFGRLYLDEGKWQDKQIVSNKWLEDSTKPHSWCQEFKLSYGYLWWIIDEKEHAFSAMGDGGNVIYVNQKKELVIATNALFVPHAKDRLKLIKSYIEPVFEA